MKNPLLELDGIIYAYPGSRSGSCPKPGTEPGTEPGAEPGAEYGGEPDSGSASPLLNGINLALFEGERIGLLGDNGSGKSTLLHIAAGLIRPASGRVLYEGRVCETEKNFITARRSLGYLLQNAEDQLFSPTVLEDVAFGPANKGIRGREAALEAADTLKRLGLYHLADRNGLSLSGGEKKLAALATVLVMKPRFLFLDEPTNDLDARARDRLLEILRESGLPMLVVSHDAPFLRSVCTAYRRLRGGRIHNADAPGTRE